MTKASPSAKPLIPWVLLVLVLAPANIQFLYNMRGPKPLAEMGVNQLTPNELPADAALEIQNAQNTSYAVYERRILEWASKIVLENEARRTHRTVEKLLEEETLLKEPISEAEIRDRYRRSPAADTRPYPAVLDDIRSALQAEKSAALKKTYLEGLFQKEGLKINISKPDGYTTPPGPSAFPVYTAPPVKALENGRVAGSPSKGPADAPVVIEIYSDFMCPFSRKFMETSEKLDAQYANRIRTVYHHFPLPMHKGADVLAEASVCAQEQGKFWEMHDALMAWQGEADPGKLAEAAQKIGADPQAFSACLSEGRYKDFVRREMQVAQSRGVNSTPTFFLNGRQVVGALPAEQVSPLIDWLENPKAEYPGKPFNPALRQQPPQGGQGAPQLDDKPVTFTKEFLSTGPSRGPADAPVTIVEFIDYNCPFCQRGAQAIDPLVKASKAPVRFLSKQLPLPMHPNAEKGAVAALCADEQGKYWQFRDEIFGASWGKQMPEDLKAAASKAGADRKKFDACLDGNKTLETVKSNAAVGATVGAQGTPTYFINGRRIVGANTPAITQALEEASAPPKK